ncbi:MAG: permease-like cell division protein FtsX, partial [Actinomycetota bacterium]
EVKIWLDVGVTAADVEAVATGLDDLQGRVVEYRYLDLDATYDEFNQFFADEPEILDLVDPEDLPTSFEVVLAPEAGAAASGGVEGYALAGFEALAGVDDVEVLLCPNLRDAARSLCSARYPFGDLSARVQLVQDTCGLGLPAGFDR